MKIQHPSDTDGYSVNELVAASPPLDTNSVYCNLLQCSHFADTSIIAKQDDKTMGFVSGYLIPQRPDTLFVWQVVVSSEARGMGLASRMLNALLESESCKDVRYVETTITPDNKPSWALFEKLASKLGTEIAESTAFCKDKHFKGHHETEQLLRIGPITLKTD